ncbi:hypothetical protein CBR_g49037 [Chara braunii]|uniref:Uncharacterized protein n=1 Tax=Chara braunii TaxID=69332 RepID=A0A388M418_CHABU|nr:hypothetical protein CBR_g49037 [Chara braunii]|eukprot:GBG89327.1 hypothetical protein CBR_g49037 [Chara braunii]
MEEAPRRAGPDVPGPIPHQPEFPYNKPAPGNGAWFTVELRDELYALRRELDRLRKKVDKISDEVNAGAERLADVTAHKIKQLVDAAVQEALTAHAGKKADDGNSQQASRGRGKDGDVSKVMSELKGLKKQLEDFQGMKYDIASLQGSVVNLKPPTRQFISPRQLLTNGKTPIKKATPKPSEALASTSKKTQWGIDPRKSARRSTARRRILLGKQISEDMLSALQMEDLKRLCAMHNVRYRSMPQARVALRKIPGLILSDTDDLPDKTGTGDEANGGRPDGDKTKESESEEEGSSSEDVEAEFSEGPVASEEVQPNAH